MKKILLSLSVALLSTTMFAKHVSIETAKLAADNQLRVYGHDSRTDYSTTDQWETKYNGVVVYYSFIYTGGGFAIISADDVADPILAWSTNEPASRNNIPENAQSFLNDFAKEIYTYITGSYSNVETAQHWDDLLNATAGKSTSAVTPLLYTPCASPGVIWDQGTGYNTYCPSGTPTGCVATSMAMPKLWSENPGGCTPAFWARACIDCSAVRNMSDTRTCIFKPCCKAAKAAAASGCSRAMRAGNSFLLAP